jgi:hypothetical protein
MIAMSFAFWLQRIIAAVHSAIQGGQMFTTNACRYLNKYKMISFDPDQSQLDEQAGYVVGVIGLYYQVRHRICIHIYEITGTKLWTHKNVYMDQFMTIAHYSLFFLFLLTFFLQLPCENKKKQLFYGTPIILSIVLLPLTICEWAIKFFLSFA